MAVATNEITIPNVRLNLDDLLALVRRLDADARQRVAQALAESEMDSRLSGLIRQIASKTPVDEISDSDIDSEVTTVRQMGS